MKNWFLLPERTRKLVFNQVGIQEGLPEGAIEKDWWVTMVLRVIFSLPVSEHLVFKGGTSLSKGWNLIQRFSEDIDLAIDRKFLGFEEELSRTQITKLKKKSCAFVKDTLARQIIRKIEEIEITGVEIKVQEVKDSDTDPVIIEFHYSSLTNDSPYLRPRVLIEIGARSLIEPSERRPIQSLVDAQFSGRNFTNLPVLIPSVLPKRTFLEKAFLLHEEFQKPLGRIRVDRLSRHLYDLEKLMHTPHGEEALKDTVLYKSIVAHREKFNPVKGVNYKSHHPATIDFVPPAQVVQKWRADYEVMKQNMIYGEPESFDMLISNMEMLRQKFRHIVL